MKLKVNNQEYNIEVPEDTPLLWVLREELKLNGTKFGCGKGLCGACTVHVGGQAVRSCSYPVSAVGKQEVKTIEGVSESGPHALQQMWIKNSVPQCGYCQSGQIMQALSLLENNKKVTTEELLEGMNGNICRCGSYTLLKQSLIDTAKQLGKWHNGN